MKVILVKFNQAVKQLISKLVNKLNYQVRNLSNRRCSSANGSITFTVGAVTSLILLRKHASRRDVVVVISLLSIFTLGLIGIGGIGVSNVSAAQSTITMSVANSIAIDVLPTTNGNFVSSSTSDTIVSIATNNYTGYNLGIAASAANSTALSYTDGESTVHTIPSISTSISASDYENDTYATSNNLNNTWGFRPSKYNSTNNTDYLPIPSGTTPTTLDTTNEPNASTANTYNIAIGARVDLNQTPGSYTNTFIITAIANPTPYTITYNANTTNTVSNLPANESSSTYADTVTISSTTPTRTGYTFVGWCNTAEATSESTCSGTLYNATNNNLSNYPIDRTASSNDVAVSAIWTVNTYTQTVNYYYQTATGAAGTVMTYTENVAYGSNFTFTSAKAASFNSTTHSTTMYTANNGTTSTTINYTVTEATTNTVYFNRNTRTVTLTKGTGISAVTVTGDGVKSGSGTASATIYYGGAATINATLSSGYDWVNWTGSATYTNQSQSVTNITSNLSFTANGKVTTTTFAQAYAAAGKSQTSGYYKMQDMTSSICSSVTDGQSGTLKDTRWYGINNYTVAKIGSLCWMTANLALGSSTAITLTPDDTNISSNYTLPARGTYGASYDGEYVWGNDTQCTSSSTTACAGYYSYAAATAGTNPSSGAASSDICPKGWRLPTQAEFNTLISSYNTGAKLKAAPFLGVYAGYYLTSSFSNGGSYGYYWSSTAGNSSGAYYLVFNSSSANVYLSLYKHGGWSIRCVAKS